MGHFRNSWNVLRVTSIKKSCKPRQNYLRIFVLHVHYLAQQNFFQIKALCKVNPSPSSKLLSTKAQGLGFLLKTQQHCFQGEGEGGEGRIATFTMFRKMLSEYAILSRVARMNWRLFWKSSKLSRNNSPSPPPPPTTGNKWPAPNEYTWNFLF